MIDVEGDARWNASLVFLHVADAPRQQIQISQLQTMSQTGLKRRGLEQRLL
jgi:hypothetical protein